MLISQNSCAALSKYIDSGERKIFCSSLYLSAKWMVISQVVKKGLHIVVLPDKESAEYCCSDLYSFVDGDNVFFLPESGKNIERSNYKSSLAVQRTSALSRILSGEENLTIIVTYSSALSENIPSGNTISSDRMIIKRGDEISHDSLSEKLYEKGFEKVDFVSEPGQYAIRGSIIDIFSFSNNYPYRISLWGDEIEKINTFDCNTQLSKDDVSEVEIISEVLSSPEEEGDCLLSMLDRNTVLWLDSSDIYSQEQWFKNWSESFVRVFLDIPPSFDKGELSVKFQISPQPKFNKNFELLTEDIRSRIENSYKVLIYSEKESQLDRIKSILSQNGGLIPDFVKGKTIHNGFIDNECKVCCYSDHEIFDRFQRVSIRRSVEKSEQLTVNDLNSFNIGDYVVHIDHGVGIFGGLVKMKDDKGRVHEVVKITYKDGDVVFVSVHLLNKISRFRSKDGEPPRINKLGSKTWSSLKTNAKSKLKDIAKELIQLYAKRRASKGFAFSADTYLQEELESSFMYEDTPDQETATISVKRDMEDDCPMDRLVCGDGGFGKTESAIRAAFKAVSDSKQVALLVPTTILALQHYKTFSGRLKEFPCKIEYISRLRSAKEIKEILQRLQSGEVDIIIGTHRLLNKEVKFKDLGLLIIDEEQKFGVAAKERLKQMKLSVDTLTLSATPIPRTLQFSLLGARDLSIINTPPPNRLPVQTEVLDFNEDAIRDAINFEVERGGQVFFVHNRVEDIMAVEEIIKRICPGIKTCVGHGQMDPKQLENIVLDFMAGDYDVLVATTIIENGIDIPNANTIIINQAQNFGLSDLHQMRGRVGRSNVRAFCYLIVPPMIALSDDARRRIHAIEAFSDLGSGFNIAMQDLDIRGAGNLLGGEQSGFIADMGFETYQRILSEAFEEIALDADLPAESTLPANISYVSDCNIDTDFELLIPDDYIEQTSEKIRLYKELDAITDEEHLQRFKAELADRFGPLPKQLEELTFIVRLRGLALKLAIEKIVLKRGIMLAYFVSDKNSPFYKSALFNSILVRLQGLAGKVTLKQLNDKLYIKAERVTSVERACSICDNLLN